MLRYLWLLLAVFSINYADQFMSEVDDLVWERIVSLIQKNSQTSDLVNSLRGCLDISNKTYATTLKDLHSCEVAAFVLESRFVNQLKHGQRDRPLKVDTISPGSAYFSLFEDYIINNRIFKADFKEAILPLAIDEVNKTASLNFRWLSSLSLPLEVAQQIVLPAIATNSYIRRLNETIISSLEIAFDDFHCYTQLCLVLGTGDIESTPYFQCPGGGNMLLWSLDSKTENVQITIAEAKKLIEKVIITPDQATRSLRMRHIFSTEQGQDTPTTTVSLSSQQLLFIPRPFAISVHNPSHVNLAMLCVVDASNLNTMRVDVRSAALAGSSAHRQLFHHLTHPSLLDTQSLVRHPAVQSLYSFVDKSAAASETTGTEVTQTTAVNKNDRRNRRQKGDFKSWQEIAAWRSFLGGLTLPPPPRPTLSSIHREDISLTFSLPLATLPPEGDRTAFGFELTVCKTSISLLSGTNLAVSLSPTAVDSEEDHPKFATCELEKTRVYLLGNASLHLSVTSIARELVDEEIANFILHVSSLSAATRYQFSLRLRYGTAMQGVQRGPSSPFTPMVTTYPLVVPTVPRPVMAHLLEVDTIRPSGGTVIASVEALNEREWWREDDEAGSVAIRFRAPEDDGGRPILGYWVFMRVAASHFPTSYHSLGSFSARLSTHHSTILQDVFEIIISRNILPLVLPLEFRIAAVSEVGVSHWSSPTLPITLSAVPFTSTEENEGEEGSSGSREKKTKLLSLLWGSNYPVSYGSMIKTLFTLPASYLANRNLELYNDVEEQAALLLLSLPHQQLSVIQCNSLPFRPPPLILSTPPPSAAVTYEVWVSHWIHPELLDSEYGLVILAATCDLYLPQQQVDEGSTDVEIKCNEEQTAQENHEQRQRCHNKIAFIPRGHFQKPMFELALQAQLAGALAAVIVDPDGGKCADEKYDQKCVPGANKKHQEGFAMQDLANLWSTVKIPVLLASHNVAEGVKKELDDLSAKNIRRKTEQNVLAQQTIGSDEL